MLCPCGLMDCNETHHPGEGFWGGGSAGGGVGRGIQKPLDLPPDFAVNVRPLWAGDPHGPSWGTERQLLSHGLSVHSLPGRTPPPACCQEASDLCWHLGSHLEASHAQNGRVWIETRCQEWRVSSSDAVSRVSRANKPNPEPRIQPLPDPPFQAVISSESLEAARNLTSPGGRRGGNGRLRPGRPIWRQLPWVMGSWHSSGEGVAVRVLGTWGAPPTASPGRLPQGGLRKSSSAHAGLDDIYRLPEGRPPSWASVRFPGEGLLETLQEVPDLKERLLSSVLEGENEHVLCAGERGPGTRRSVAWSQLCRRPPRGVAGGSRDRV